MEPTKTQQNAGGPDLSQYPNIDNGLEGIVAFSSHKSFIDGAKGELIYAGYNIEVLAEKATFEEVCFLLWHERLPKSDELKELNNLLTSQREVPNTVYSYLKGTSVKAEPMSVLRTATSMLADTDVDALDNSPEANLRKSIRLTAKMPTIIAAYDRIRNGLDPV